MWPSSPLPLGEREASEASRERAVASLSGVATSLSPALRADPLPQPAKRPEGERGRKIPVTPMPDARHYDAVIFDLPTALLDSWTLWNRVAGSAEDGARWRRKYLE